MKNIQYRFIRVLLYIFIPLLHFPSVKTSYGKVGMTTLLCHRDVPYFFYSLASFWFFLKERLPVYVVDDGTLSRFDKWLIRFFLHLDINSVTEVDKHAAKYLKPYQMLYQFRFDNDSPILRKKIDAILLSPFKKSIYFDSDILFFNFPAEVFTWINKKKRRYGKL